jgi:SAM-dependent methyltransferase
MPRFFSVVLMLILVSSAYAEQKAEDPQLKQLRRISNKIYTESSGDKFTSRPNAFLMEMVRGLKPGKALDVGMGQGRNSLFLAQQGWDVTGFDISETGVSQALEQAGKLKVRIDARVQHSSDFDFGTERWDLVVLCYLDFRHLLERVRQSLRPGGVVILEYYHRDTRKMRYLPERKSYASNELLQIFSDFRILHYEDVMAKPDWNFYGEEKQRLVRLMAQKNGGESVVNCTMEEKVYPLGEEICQKGLQLKCGKTGWDKKGVCSSKGDRLRFEEHIE